MLRPQTIPGRGSEVPRHQFSVAGLVGWESRALTVMNWRSWLTATVAERRSARWSPVSIGSWTVTARSGRRTPVAGDAPATVAPAARAPAVRAARTVTVTRRRWRRWLVGMCSPCRDR